MRVVGYVVHGGGVLDVLRRGLVEQAPVQEVGGAVRTVLDEGARCELYVDPVQEAG